MPSLRTLDVVHRLNAPTRAAAARRRRLRKAAAIACLMLAALVLMPGGHDDGRANAASAGDRRGDGGGAASTSALSGRHALALRPLTPVSAEARRVDVWTDAGLRLVRCAPTLAGHSDAGAGSRLTETRVTGTAQDATVTVALTDAELVSVTRHLGQVEGSPQGLIVSACL